MHPLHLFAMLGEVGGQETEIVGGGPGVDGSLWQAPADRAACREARAAAKSLRREFETRCGLPEDDSDDEETSARRERRRLESAVAGLVQKGAAQAVRAFFDASAGVVDELRAVAHDLIATAADTLATLLSRGFDIDARNDLGQTALMTTARDFDPVAVAALIEAGADPTLRDKEDRTAVYFAGMNPDPKGIRLILAHCDAGLADVAASDGQTPLMCACAQDNRGAVAALVSIGANVDATNRDGETALHETTTDDIREILLDAGANVDVVSIRTGRTPLMQMCGRRAPIYELEAALLRSAKIDRRDRDGETALFYATAASDVDAVETLLRYHAEKDVTSHDGSTAFDLACELCSAAASDETADAAAHARRAEAETIRTLLDPAPVCARTSKSQSSDSNDDADRFKSSDRFKNSDRSKSPDRFQSSASSDSE
jgi:ankyrin repeat protein